MSEDVSSVTVAVSLLNGTLARDLIVSLLTLSGTAVGESDYELSSAYATFMFNICNANVIFDLHVISFLNPAGMDFLDTDTDLTFSPSLPTQTAMVSIIDDPVPEEMFEYFSLILTSTDRAAILDPTTANATIVDNMDSKNHHMCAISCFIL